MKPINPPSAKRIRDALPMYGVRGIRKDIELVRESFQNGWYGPSVSGPEWMVACGENMSGGRYVYLEHCPATGEWRVGIGRERDGRTIFGPFPVK